jgi:hypothetical protein
MPALDESTSLCPFGRISASKAGRTVGAVHPATTGRVTNDGIVSVVDPESGAVRATHEREALIFSRPTLADVDGDGDAEGFVMYGDGRVVAFDFGG